MLTILFIIVLRKSKFEHKWRFPSHWTYFKIVMVEREQEVVTRDVIRKKKYKTPTQNYMTKSIDPDEREESNPKRKWRTVYIQVSRIVTSSLMLVSPEKARVKCKDSSKIINLTLTIAPIQPECQCPPDCNFWLVSFIKKKTTDCFKLQFYQWTWQRVLW